MPRVGFEPTISAGERPKTYALDRAATGTGIEIIIQTNFEENCFVFLLRVCLNFTAQGRFKKDPIIRVLASPRNVPEVFVTFNQN